MTAVDPIVVGLDVGTSAVKAVLVDGGQRVLAGASRGLDVSRPRPGWSEQDPLTYIAAVRQVLGELQAAMPEVFARAGAIGLSGQMHGAVLVDAAGKPLRPAILWNDARAEAECAEMLAEFPQLPEVAGVIPMPGFTAPKLRWLKKHEPAVVAATAKVLCAKDFVRLWLTGEHATDMCDAAGTLWLDEAKRAWSERAVMASGLELSHMPALVEGTAVSGRVRPSLATELGWRGAVVVAGGAGDAAAAGIGLGALDAGDAYISLGTSSQLFVTMDRYRPRPETLVHAFAHAVPDRWFQMAAMLNGASCLAWYASAMGGGASIEALLAEAEHEPPAAPDPIFLPYLAGERTPHNDSAARGVFFGLSGATTRASLTRAVLTGVAYTLREAREVLAAADSPLTEVGVTGGGTRNRYWLQIIADATGLKLARYDGTELGPAFGAARLGRIALTGEAVAAVCTKPPVVDRFAPRPETAAVHKTGFERYQQLYRALKPEFERAVAGPHEFS